MKRPEYSCLAPSTAAEEAESVSDRDAHCLYSHSYNLHLIFQSMPAVDSNEKTIWNQDMKRYDSDR